MDYPLWFVELEYYEPGNENVELVELMLDLKENVTLRRVDKECVFTYILIKDSHQNISKHVEANIIYFHTSWMVESGCSAVVDVLSRKKLSPNSKGRIKLRLNNFIKIYNILCQKHQDQGSH